MAPRTLLVTATLAALALAAPLHESRNSGLRIVKRLEGEIVPQTGTVKHGCLTRHEWNPPPSETHPTACGYTMDKINQLTAEGKFYISLPEDVWLATKTAQWPNPICGKQVTVKNLSTNKEQKGIVMDLNNFKREIKADGTLGSVLGPTDPAYQHCYAGSEDYGPGSVDVTEALFTALGGADGPLAVVEFTIDMS